VTDRDTFAAAAMTGLLAAPTCKDKSWDYWARCSYEMADAMLKHRSAGRQPDPQDLNKELERLRGVIDTYAEFACLSERYIKALRQDDDSA